jgi:hypothetical protein
MDTVPWVLNPGAAGRTRTYGGPSCLLLIAGETDWKVEVHRFAFLTTRPKVPNLNRHGARRAKATLV